ncbi:MAG: acetyl-CoA C-acetyltransferase, partial [Proteobacteria bacterium]|nr:acetyl-CoA C-acetyltransferase [Pseudomonadota bacterium]
MSQSLRRIAVIGGTRIPFCRSNTLYADLSNLEMMTTALEGLVGKYKLEGAHIDEVTGGAVVTHSRDWNLAREAVIGSHLAPSTPGITMMQACGTSLQAAMGIGAKIAMGEIESGIAIGSDTTSDAPIVVGKRLAGRLIQAQQAKSMGQRLSAFKGFSPSELVPQPPSTSEPRTGLSMGQHCELMAQHWHIPREAQDQLALESHAKAAAAYRSGFMDDLVIPCAGVWRDNNLREDMDPEKIAALRTVFDRTERGTLTAANSTPLTDGAAAVLLGSEEWARKRGLKPQAYLTHFQTSANDFVAGEGLLMAPTIAVARLLQRANLKLQDFDFYEIHEAFAAQVLATLKAWEDPDYCRTRLGLDAPLGSIDRAKLNVK